MDGELTAKFVTRMPAGMHQALKARAARNRRSMNSEILVLLHRGMATPEDDGTTRTK